MTFKTPSFDIPEKFTMSKEDKDKIVEDQELDDWYERDFFSRAIADLSGTNEYSVQAAQVCDEVIMVLPANKSRGAAQNE